MTQLQDTETLVASLALVTPFGPCPFLGGQPGGWVPPDGANQGLGRVLGGTKKTAEEDGGDVSHLQSHLCSHPIGLKHPNVRGAWPKTSPNEP